MEQLIKIDDKAMKPLSKVAIAFMDKMEKALGWIVMPKGKGADQEEAIRFYIQEIEKKEEMPPLMRAALISQARKTLKEYCNINDIVQIAIEQMDKNANPEELDDDWFSYFYEHAKNMNREDVKILWGKLLASECNKSGSVPKTLIHILSMMSKENADDFESLCGFIVDTYNSKGFVEKILIVPPDYSSISEGRLSYDKIMNLEALGLLNQTDKLRIYFDDDIPPIDKVVYNDSEISLKYKTNYLFIGEVNLTNSGRVLSNIIIGKKLMKYVDYLKLYFETNSIIVDIIQSNTLN